MDELATVNVRLSDFERCNADLDRLEDENAKLRELTKDACTVLRGFFDPEWFDETVFAERMRELGIEVE